MVSILIIINNNIIIIIHWKHNFRPDLNQMFTGWMAAVVIARCTRQMECRKRRQTCTVSNSLNPQFRQLDSAELKKTIFE